MVTAYQWNNMYNIYEFNTQLCGYTCSFISLMQPQLLVQLVVVLKIITDVYNKRDIHSVHVPLVSIYKCYKHVISVL